MQNVTSNVCGNSFQSFWGTKDNFLIFFILTYLFSLNLGTLREITHFTIFDVSYFPHSGKISPKTCNFLFNVAFLVCALIGKIPLNYAPCTKYLDKLTPIGKPILVLGLDGWMDGRI